MYWPHCETSPAFAVAVFSRDFFMESPNRSWVIAHSFPGQSRRTSKCATQKVSARCWHITPNKRFICFTPVAYREWKEFQKGIEPQFRGGGMLEDLKDWGSKLPGAAARIAGVMHMAMWAGRPDTPTEIDRSTVAAAVEIAACPISHCRAIFKLSGSGPRGHKGPPGYRLDST